MDFNEESNEEESGEKSFQDEIKQWFQDNVRIIISILIVVLIAGGIYSYSKRTEAPLISEETSTIDSKSDDKTTTETKKTTDSKEVKATPEGKTTSKTETEKTSSIATSQETEKSFIETAAKGDSQTKLARKALANFLEKNADSEITAEHKIYIEDYLRKNVQHSGKVSVGTSIEFSKDLIKDAIAQSKKLNENQLKNLHKYVVLVPSLS